MTPLVSLLACHPEPERPPGGGACRGVTDTTFSGGTDVVLDAPGCAVLRLTAFEPLGDGSFAVTVFSGGDRVLGYVEPTVDGVLDGLRIRGTLRWDTEGAATGWAWPDDGAPASLPGGLPAAGAWAASVTRGGATALVGAVGGETAQTRVELDADGFELVQGGALGLRLPAGRGVYFDPVALVVADDPGAAWIDWGALVADQAAAPPASPLPPGVELPFDATPGEVDAALAAWPEARVVTFGAGWPPVAGDYDADPGTLAAAMDRVRASGRRAGLVLDALAVDPDAPISRDHPEWLVTDAAGVPVVAAGRQVLDGTDAGAVRWLAGALDDRLGPIDPLVVTGLAAAAAPGVRDGGLLGAAGLRSGLGQLRRALRGAVVAGDGPELTVVGVVDARRSPDATGDARRAGVAVRLPLAGVLPPDPAPLAAGGAADLAADVATGTLRLSWTADGAWGPALAAIAPHLGAPAAPPSDPTWSVLAGPELTSLVAPDGAPVTVDGPGGTELLGGATAGPGPRDLPAGTGEIWAPR